MMNLDGIIGHERVKKSLMSLDYGGEMPHAVLFTGQRGVGKRLIADRFTGSFICLKENGPCGICDSCRQVAVGTYPDLLILERDDKGKIPVGNRERVMPGTVRWLIEKLSKAPSTGCYSVIIDGVDTISEAGQNALLKTIEEPYSKAYIILIADSRSGILPTIISRCIEIPFQPLKNSEILSIIKQKGIERAESGFISLVSGGSADIATDLHDEKILEEVKRISYAISDFIRGGNNTLFSYTESKTVPDSEFLIDVLINIYGLIARGGAETIIPEGMNLSHESAVKTVRILLALKRGLGNNFNVKNMIKGFLYSFNEVDTVGFPEADFTWLK